MKTFQEFLENVYLMENPTSNSKKFGRSNLSGILQRILGPGISDTQIPLNRPNWGKTSPLGLYYPGTKNRRAEKLGVYTPPPRNSYKKSADRTGGTQTIRIPEKDIKKITPKDLSNPLDKKNIIPKYIPFA